MALSIAEHFLLQDLRRRVEALELAQTGHDHLERQNVRRRADGERLRTAIRRIMANHPDPAELSAKHVLRMLQATDIGRAELPSVRTVQWHMHAIRNAAGIASDKRALTETHAV